MNDVHVVKRGSTVLVWAQ